MCGSRYPKCDLCHRWRFGGVGRGGGLKTLSQRKLMNTFQTYPSYFIKKNLSLPKIQSYF